MRNASGLAKFNSEQRAAGKGRMRRSSGPRKAAPQVSVDREAPRNDRPIASSPAAAAPTPRTDAATIWLNHEYGTEPFVSANFARQLERELAEWKEETERQKKLDCPWASPFRFCQTCAVNPCPIGLGDKTAAAPAVLKRNVVAQLGDKTGEPIEIDESAETVSQGEPTETEIFRRALQRIAITDDADCAHANDPEAMKRIAREALR